jgi:hypothetical protein
MRLRRPSISHRANRILLEEYRDRLIERLMSCPDPGAAGAIVAEAEPVLASRHLLPFTRDKFWESLHQDLAAVRDSARLLKDREAGARLAAVAAAAQARIARFRDSTVDPATAGEYCVMGASEGS